MTDGTAPAVLDASALLAYILGEAGRETVGTALVSGAVINAVNYAEVLSRLVDTGDDAAAADRRLRQEGLIGDLLNVVPLSEEDSVTIARLRALTRGQGVSLGDRACLATGLGPGRPVITADRAWAGIDVGVTVHLIRL